VLQYTLLALTAAATLLVSTVRPDNVAIDQIIVMDSLGSAGHNNLALTRELMDEMRHYYDRAAEEVTGIEVGGSGVDRSVNSFIDYFNLQSLANDFRDAAGLTSYHVTSEIVPEDDGIRFRARIFAIDRTGPVSVVTVRGKKNEFEPMLKEAALKILTVVNPYLVGVHLYDEELGRGDYGFPQSRAMIDRWLAEPGHHQHYLALELLGRIHRATTELDTKLDQSQRDAELGLAAECLKAALAGRPGLYFANANLGMVYADRGDYALADQFFAKAVGIDPNKLMARQRWGEVLAGQRRYREAIIQYVAAVELAPEDTGLRDRLADLYLVMQRKDAAREQWQAALAIDPTNQRFAEKLRALGP
jgi:hypothetical protein